jgi:hypothetical protein
MNVLAYNSQDPAKVGPKVEELLRTETGATAPLAYDVESAGVGKSTAGTVLREAVATLFGTSEVRLFTLNFALTSPRPANVEVHMHRQGVGCHAGPLLYSTQLSKKVGGEVWLGEPKTFGTAQFEGDPGTAAKLNASKELCKKADAFARTKTQLGGLDITAPRLLRIGPEGPGSLLVAATLGRPHMMGFKVSMESKAFFELAKMIEDAL